MRYPLNTRRDNKLFHAVVAPPRRLLPTLKRQSCSVREESHPG